MAGRNLLADEAPAGRNLLADDQNASRWDIPGDVGREFTRAVDAFGSNALNATTSGHIGPTGEGMMGVLKRTGQDILALPGKFASGVMAPFNAMGVVASPITGTLKATAGSGISYLPGMDKPKADEAIDLALMGARPAGVAVTRSLPLPTRPAPAPTNEELTAAANQQYDAARNTGLEVRTESPARLANDIRTSLYESGFVDENHPKTFRAVRQIENTTLPPRPLPTPQGWVRDPLDQVLPPASESMTSINDLISARHALNKARMAPGEGAAARLAINQLDAYLMNIPPEMVAAGDPALANTLFRNATGNWAAAARSEEAAAIPQQLAADRTATTASGGNLNNATRQELRKLLDKHTKGNLPGYTQDEIDQLRRAVTGTHTGNTLRSIGNFFGGGGGMGRLHAAASGAAAGGAIGGPVGAAVGTVAGPITGILARAGATRSTLRQAGLLDEMLRARSPLAQSRAPIPINPNYLAPGLLYGGMLDNGMR